MCGGKISSTCGGKNIYATCVKYEGDIAESGELNECDCHTVDEVLEDHAHLLDKIHEQVFHTNLPDCIEFDEEDDGTVSNLNAVKAIAEKLCEVVALVGIDEEDDCPTCNDPCSTNNSCCDSLVFNAYNDGEVAITSVTFPTWGPLTGYTGLDYTVTKAGNYEVTIDLGCFGVGDSPKALLGIGVGLADPAIGPFTQYVIDPSKNSRTFHFVLIGAKPGDVFKPKVKFSVGEIDVDGLKIIIKKV